MRCAEGTGGGINTVVPRERMSTGARKLRDAYARIPGAPLLHREFSFMEGTLERWQMEGMPKEVPREELFGYDQPGEYYLRGLGDCEAAFLPRFAETQVEDRGEHEVVQDSAGRHLLVFKGRRNGFMPEYLTHPVKDMATWERDVRWRLDPTSTERFASLAADMSEAVSAAAQGMIVSQQIVGGYMYLRSLIGPVDLLLAFYDQPDLVHACMRVWFDLADAVTARHQEFVTFDQVRLDEDICYNRGALISPRMIQEFLFPYYQQLMKNIASRQLDKTRHLYVHVDTDGYAPAVLDLYCEGIGMDAMSPFEVAAGCDVVAIGRRYPGLVMCGGIDKRVLSRSPAEIDAFLARVIPQMRARGGYVPTCDHGVPAEVSYKNYRHYRRRMKELGG